MEENDNTPKEGIEDVLREMHNIGINCGREISRMAKVIHPDCVAIIPLYRSCIVIMQSEEEKEKGECTIHSYGDPHWLGEDIDIDILKKDEFHSEFKIHGQRRSPELIFENGSTSARLPIDRGFNIIDIATKYIDSICKNFDTEICGTRSGHVHKDIAGNENRADIENAVDDKNEK